MWANVDDANMRLRDSIIRLRGNGFHVESVSDDWYIRGMDLISREGFYLPLEGEPWNFSPVPCGWVNGRHKIIFVERMPVRKWKQGLHKDNIKTIPDEISKNIIFTSMFGQTIANLYPGFEECFNAVQTKEREGQAFSRDYAIFRSRLGIPFLVFRGDRVGWFEQNTAVFGEGWEFLKEEFEEVRNANP